MKSPAERFRTFYQESAGCWEWRGSRYGNGYGSFYISGGRADPKTTRAHRFAWELANGHIPDGLEIHHRCGNRGCVNPAHLELVTHQENMRLARGWKKEPVAHCKHGHPFDEENTRLDPKTGQRICRTCARERMARRRGPRVRPEPRSCRVCGRIFTPDRHPNAMYCSGACRTAAHRASKGTDIEEVPL